MSTAPPRKCCSTTVGVFLKFSLPTSKMPSHLVITRKTSKSSYRLPLWLWRNPSAWSKSSWKTRSESSGRIRRRPWEEANSINLSESFSRSFLHQSYNLQEVVWMEKGFSARLKGKSNKLSFLTKLNHLIDSLDCLNSKLNIKLAK